MKKVALGGVLLLAAASGASMAAPMTMTHSVGNPFEAFSYDIFGCGPIHCEGPWSVQRTAFVPKFNLSGFRLLGITVDFSLYAEDGAVVFNDKPFVENTNVIASMHNLGWLVGPLSSDHYGGTLACNGVPGGFDGACTSGATLQPLQTFVSTVASLSYSGSTHYDSAAALMAFSGGGDRGLTMRAAGSLNVFNLPSSLDTSARVGTRSSFIVTYEFCNFRTDENCSERIPEPGTAALAVVALVALPFARLRRKRSTA